MERWLARELCSHRDPSLVRFYVGNGPRGTLDLAARRRHLATNTTNTSTSGGGGGTTIVDFNVGGSGSNWTPPSGVTSVTIECWGAGGGGCDASGTDSSWGGGGGGGGYCTITVAVATSNTFNYTVGAANGGDSYVTVVGGVVANAGPFTASGGLNGTTSAGGAGGGYSGSGTTGTSGSNGGYALDSGSGGNGGFGGTGGISATLSGTHIGGNGTTPGGGGGGAGHADYNSGNGGNGRVRFTYSTTPTVTTTVTNNTHFQRLSNLSKQGLTFGDNTQALLQRLFDPKSSAAKLTDVSFGVNNDFTVMCWVYGNGSGPLAGVQGNFEPASTTTPYGLRGWAFGVQQGGPYLEMYSDKTTASGTLVTSEFGLLQIYSDIGVNSAPMKQQWAQVACVFRGSAIPWGKRYNSGGSAGPTSGASDTYSESAGFIDVKHRPYIDFFRNGRRISANITSQSQSSVNVNKLTSFIPATTGTTYGSTNIANAEPVFSIGSELTLQYASPSTTTQAYDSFNGSGCLFRVYNRALTNDEIADIYRREQFLFQYKPFQDYPPEVAIGISLFLRSHIGITSSMPLVATGIGLGLAGIPLYTGSSSTITKGITATAWGNSGTNVSAPLSTHGVFALSHGMPLFAAADAIRSINSNISLFTFGAMRTGMTRGLPLYTYADPFAKTPSKSIPLFAQAVTKSTTTRLMNMYANGHVSTAVTGINLTAWNVPPQDGLTPHGLTAVNISARRLSRRLIHVTPRPIFSGSNSIPLFVSGYGVTNNAVPLGKSMNLVLRRTPAAAMTLYAHAPGQIFGSPILDLFAWGLDHKVSSLSLSVPNIVGLSPVPVKLYASGF